MRRREFIALVAGLVALKPSTLRAQAVKTFRIGALYIGIADEESFRSGLREGLREFGYIEGQNISFEFRSADGKLDRLPGLAGELAQLKVDVGTIRSARYPARKTISFIGLYGWSRNIGNLDSSALHHCGTKSRVLKSNMLIGNGLNHLFGHAASCAQPELLAGVVERID
jgi:hypothetical protein